MDHIQILEKIYDEALKTVGDGNVSPPHLLSEEEITELDFVVSNSETRKAVLTVLVTSLVHKVFDPKQDTRLHQSNLPGGYSGRTLDTQVITPFMKHKSFPAMVESGWLTRSFEQNSPYNLEYRGKVTPVALKKVFLSLIDNIETKNRKPELYLNYLFQMLIKHREESHIEISQPVNISKYSIAKIIRLLVKHFSSGNEVGTARLPVLAVYSAYQCMMSQLKRYDNKVLTPLGSHTSADKRSGDIGDINITNFDDKKPFEGVEVKYGKKITSEMVVDSYKKYLGLPVNRYYLLSTEICTKEELVEIENAITDISAEHGCQVIVNGLIPTLKYYLRLFDNTDEFIDRYTQNVLSDPAIKTTHKELWRDILGEADSL